MRDCTSAGSHVASVWIALYHGVGACYRFVLPVPCEEFAYGVDYCVVDPDSSREGVLVREL